MFPDEAACVGYLEELRWPDGFACRTCGVVGEPQRIRTRPRVRRCRACLEEVSVTAGTILHATRTPLQAWFWAAYLITSQTPGMSALQFQRQLGIGRYETTFQMLHKLRAAMVRPDRDRIGGEWVVEVDETNVGGRTRGEGRGVHDMAIVVGAVADEFTERVVARTKGLKLGPGTDPETYLGPVIDRRAQETILAHIELAKHEGARLLV
jgi:hypothetical protein